MSASKHARCTSSYLRIATGGGTERKQRWPVATVATDRNPRPYDDAETVPQGVNILDGRMHAVHHPEGVAVELQRSGGQSRPSLDSAMDQPLHKSDGGKFAVDGVDVLRATVA